MFPDIVCGLSQLVTPSLYGQSNSDSCKLENRTSMRSTQSCGGLLSIRMAPRSFGLGGPVNWGATLESQLKLRETKREREREW